MRDFSLGPNVSTRDSTFTHAFSVRFETAADLHAYLQSDSHERFVRERWRPIVEQHHIVSYETGGRAGRPRGPYGMEYARIEVPDMARTIEFLQYHVGLQLEQHTDEYAYLRTDIEHHSIELISAPEREAGHTSAVGYSVENDEILADLRKRRGRLPRDPGAPGPPEGLLLGRLRGARPQRPHHRAVHRLPGVRGTTTGRASPGRPRPPVHRDDEVRGVLDFYTNVLGFQSSDEIVGSTTFLRCEDRYHHSLALQNNKEHYVAHLCFATKSLDHVMRFRARALYKGEPIASDMVNHSASTSIAFYMHEPKHGPRYELCDRHRVFTPEEHETHRPRRMPPDPRNIDVWRPAADDWGRF